MWTLEEDTALREAIVRFGETRWKDVARAVHTRSHLQCIQRWKKSLKPGLHKGPWSSSEDDVLMMLIHAHGRDTWGVVASGVEGRNAKQCRERWFMHLDPSINKAAWSSAEDASLVEAYDATHGSWSKIARVLERRTENGIKTRFHALQREAVRARGWLPEEDALVLALAPDFAAITKKLPGRTAVRIKKRFAALTSGVDVKREKTVHRKGSSWLSEESFHPAKRTSSRRAGNSLVDAFDNFRKAFFVQGSGQAIGRASTHAHNIMRASSSGLEERGPLLSTKHANEDTWDHGEMEDVGTFSKAEPWEAMESDSPLYHGLGSPQQQSGFASPHLGTQSGGWDDIFK